MKHYDDSLTFAAVKIGAEVAGAPLEAALELFGKYFVDFAVRAGYGKLLPFGHSLRDSMDLLVFCHRGSLWAQRSMSCWAT